MPLNHGHHHPTMLARASDTGGESSFGGSGRRASIEDVVSEAADRQGDAKAYCEYLAIRPNDAGAIKAAGGSDVSGFTHAIDASAVRHILNRHGPNGTADQTVTAADFAQLPDIVGGPDRVDTEPPSKATRGLATIIYRKRFGGEWLVVEEVRIGRRRLALVSMYKEKATAP